MKTIIFTFLVLGLGLSQPSWATDNSKVYVVAFSSRISTPSKVAQELSNAGLDVVGYVDKHPDGRSRRIQWVEVSINSQSELDFLRDTFLHRGRTWVIERYEVWTQAVPAPILFENARVDTTTQTDVSLAQTCQQFFMY